jgi:glutaredoxin
LLAEKGYHYAEINLPHTERSRVLGAIVGAKTVPQVFINGQHIGGWEELEKWASAQ